MRIVVNGQTVEMAEGLSVRHCLDVQQFMSTEDDIRQSAVVVELNRHIVYAENFAETILKEGDILEVLHFVGGG